ncbi:MAG: sulfatase [bacterium]|nr:sulfatase [bacterium]
MAGAGIGLTLGRAPWAAPAGQDAPAAAETAGTSPVRRPNFIFIMTDDQAVDALGASGRYPFLKTPNLDRLGREGATFTNAFVTNSLCSPSRATCLSGCYSHVTGVVSNEGSDPRPGTPMVQEELRRAGYETAFIGKWHMKLTDQPRPGFDYWLSFLGQGTYENPRLNENGRQFQARGYMTDLLTDAAERWLRTPREKPFCLFFWHKAVHGIEIPAPRHKGLYAGRPVKEPPNFADDYHDKPAYLRRQKVYGPHKKPWTESEGKPIPDKLPVGKWNPNQKGTQRYMETLLAVDESVGRVLKALEETGRLDDTFILFTSDNGYFLGDHARGDKRLMWEESIRVPLLVRYPPLARPGAKIPEIVLNIDYAPTFLDLAGAAAPAAMQGRSFAPLLRGRTEGWRKSYFYEYFLEDYAPGFVTAVGVRTERYKYIEYPDLKNDINELYDLQTDPIEMHNLIGDPAARPIRDELKIELERLKKETGYPADGKA